MQVLASGAIYLGSYHIHRVKKLVAVSRDVCEHLRLTNEWIAERLERPAPPRPVTQPDYYDWLIDEEQRIARMGDKPWDGAYRSCNGTTTNLRLPVPWRYHYRASRAKRDKDPRTAWGHLGTCIAHAQTYIGKVSGRSCLNRYPCQFESEDCC